MHAQPRGKLQTASQKSLRKDCEKRSLFSRCPHFWSWCVGVLIKMSVFLFWPDSPQPSGIFPMFDYLNKSNSKCTMQHMLRTYYRPPDNHAWNLVIGIFSKSRKIPRNDAAVHVILSVKQSTNGSSWSQTTKVPFISKPFGYNLPTSDPKAGTLPPPLLGDYEIIPYNLTNI